MSKPIGPSFAAELQAAGLRDGIGWDAQGGLLFGSDVAAGTRLAAQAVYAAHDPSTPAPAVVPSAVTRYQAEVYMRRIGIWKAADTLFMAMPDDDERKIAWLRAPTVERYSPSTLYALEQLNIAPEAADAMFVEAKKVE